MTLCLIGMIIFLVLCWVIAAYYNKRTTNADDFLVAGRAGKFWVLIGSFMGSFFGGALIAGLVGNGYATGMKFSLSILPAAPFIIVSVTLFSKRLWILGAKYHLLSIPDFLALRFGNRIRVPGVIFVFFRMGFVTGLQILATGLVFQTAYGISLKAGMAIGAAMLISYVAFGGAKASMVTEWFQSLLQSIIMVVFALLPLFAIGKGLIGGLTAIRGTYPDIEFSIFNLPSNQIFNYFLVAGLYYFADQWIFGRVFSAESPKTAFRYLTLGNLVCLCLCMLPFISGFAIRYAAEIGALAIPDTVAAGSILYYYAMNLVPVGLSAFFLICYMAAIFSCGSGFILSGAAIAAKDIYKTFINKDATDRQMIRVSRYSTLIVAGMGTIGALWIPNLTVLYNMGNALTACGLLVPVICAFLWKRATSAGAVAATWGGGLSGLTAAIYSTISSGGASVMITPQGIPVMSIGIAVGLILMVAVSLATKPDAEERINLTAYDKILLDYEEVA